MKLLVVSDSHGNLEHMIRAVEQESPHIILHLGDGWEDGVQLGKLFPHIPLHQVAGNCDFRPTEPIEQLLFIEDKRILICHGHTYHVKQSLIHAAYTAEEQNLDIFLFGHTHHPLVEIRGKTLFFNPGSIGDHLHPFYGIITLENGKMDAQTVALQQ